MTSIRLTNFKGIAPKISSRLLADTMAQTAANVRLSSGTLIPLNQPALVHVPTVPAPHISLYRAKSLWFVWNKDVDVVPSPLPGDLKYIYTGDGEPRITTLHLASLGGTNYPMQWRVLGVHPPLTAPSVNVLGGSGPVVSRYYCYTFYDTWNQESAPSPLSTLVSGNSDGTWQITGLDIAPSNTGNILALTYSGKEVTITSDVLHFNRVGEYITVSGVASVTNVNGTWKLTKVDTSAKTMSFLVDSLPSGVYAGGGVWFRVAPFNTCTKRLYRTVGTTGQFRLVAEGISGTIYNDTLTDAQILGDELISADWAMPPSDLKGIFMLPSGSLGGFSGNEVCFSEPYQPHAWPAAYRIRVAYPIVNAQPFTSGIVVGTKGSPVVITGTEPGRMLAQSIDSIYPCLSKRSMVSLGDRVGYATEQGFVTIGDSGIDILTKDWFTRNEWSRYFPFTMVSAFSQGKLYIMTYGSLPQMLIFDLTDTASLTTTYIHANELFVDAESGKMYVSEDDKIKEFDPCFGVASSLDWLSKEYVLASPVNLGAAKVVFTKKYTEEEINDLIAAYNDMVNANLLLYSSGDIDGDVNSTYLNCFVLNGSRLLNAIYPVYESPVVSFKLYVNNKLIFSKMLTDSKAFKLPAGYKIDNFAVRVQGQVEISSIELASTMLGLKNA